METLVTGDLFRFKEKNLNTRENWMVTEVKNYGGNIVVHYIPEFTPVANHHMYHFGSLEIIKIQDRQIES